MALAIGLVSRRGQPIFFAMATSAVAYAFNYSLRGSPFLLLVRAANSPFGHVLKANRENPFRAEALRYRAVFHSALPRGDEPLAFGAPSVLCDRMIVIHSAGRRPGLEWRRF